MVFSDDLQGNAARNAVTQGAIDLGTQAVGQAQGADGSFDLRRIDPRYWNYAQAGGRMLTGAALSGGRTQFGEALAFPGESLYPTAQVRKAQNAAVAASYLNGLIRNTPIVTESPNTPLVRYQAPPHESVIGSSAAFDKARQILANARKTTSVPQATLNFRDFLPAGPHANKMGPPVFATPYKPQPIPESFASKGIERYRDEITNWRQLADAYQDIFGYDRRTALMHAALAESTARGYVDQNGGSTEDWYSKNLSILAKGGQELAQNLGGFGDEQGVTVWARRWTKDPGDLRQMMVALSAPDKTTALHEFGHIFRRMLPPKDQILLDKWVGVEPGMAWNADQEEMFVDNYERWLQGRKAPNESLAGLFAQFKQWYTEVLEKMAFIESKRPQRGKLFNRGVVDLLSKYHGDISDILGEIENAGENGQ